MSTKRKLRRAQQSRAAHLEAAPARLDKAVLRRRLESERFKTPGADKLWLALLGWTEHRRTRAWLLQAVHDGARAKEKGTFDAGVVVAQFGARSPECAAQLDRERVEAAVDLWVSGGDDYRPHDPAPKWHYLANLARDIGLGEDGAEALQEDWELWTSLDLASAPRQALMEALAHTERAAAALHAVTHSEPVEAVANVTRLTWAALAYGDEDLFNRLGELSRQWLARSRSRS